MRQLKELLLDALFPPVCLACETLLADADRDKGICKLCFNTILFATSLFCATCHARLPEGHKVCHFDTSYILAAATSYDNPVVQRLIWRLKYEKVRPAAIPLAYILEHHLQYTEACLPAGRSDFQKIYNGDVAVVPIPLHRFRRRERGFNQSLLIARALCDKLKIPLLENLLIRERNTDAQAKLKGAERERNVAGCFRIGTVPAKMPRTIILLDDVTTSGNTLASAVTALRNIGVKKICALVVAKAR